MKFYINMIKFMQTTSKWEHIYKCSMQMPPGKIGMELENLFFVFSVKKKKQNENYRKMQKRKIR